MMKEMIGAVGGALVLMFSMQYVVYQLLLEDLSNKKNRYIFICIIQSLLIILVHSLNQGISRVIILYIMVVIGNLCIYRKNLAGILMAVFLAYIMLFVSESIFTLFIVFLSKTDIQFFKETFFLTFITNLMISIIILLLLKINPLSKFFRYLVKNANKIHKSKVLIISFLTIALLNLILYYLYFEINVIYTMLFNLALILMYSGLTIMFFKENNDKEKIKSKYDNMVNVSEKYEKIVERLRMSNHENKNNLIVLKGMIKDQNKDIKAYINDLINDKHNDDNELLLKTSMIPTGGLQGLIYQKLLDMKDKNIEYHIEVSKDINKKKIERIDVKTNKNLCTIVGVFLDNAIQAVESINEKNIGIYLYQENDEFIISISNTYKGELNLQKMENKGYTTKSDGHGYGLSLVKDIIDKNNSFKNERMIRGNVFIQKISLKIEKK